MRNYYIDNLRGIVTLSVIFIHTVFWSGMGYIPEYIRNIALFLDVPIFFLLTGFIIAISDKLEPLKQIVKLILSFSILVICYQLLFWDFSLDNLILSLSGNAAILDKFPVVNGSYWFVPVYTVSLLISYIFIKYYSRAIFLFIAISFLYYILEYFWGRAIHYSVLGVALDSLLFFTSIILIGFLLYKKPFKYFYLLSVFLSLSFYLALCWLDNSAFNLQSYKFPIGLPYVVASFISIFLSLFLLHASNFLHDLKIPIVNYIGKNSIYFYMSQGIGGSLIYYYVNWVDVYWIYKMLSAFFLNFLISYIIGLFFINITTFSKSVYSRFF